MTVSKKDRRHTADPLRKNEKALLSFGTVAEDLSDSGAFGSVYDRSGQILNIIIHETGIFFNAKRRYFNAKNAIRRK